MSEINGSQFSVNKINFQGVQKQTAETPVENTGEATTPQINDFSNAQAEALGRSMLFKGNDSVNNDLKALSENPQIADNSDKIFEAAYKIAQENGVGNPYEEAAMVATTEV